MLGMVVVANKSMNRRIPDNTMHSCSQASVAFRPFNDAVSLHTCVISRFQQVSLQ